MTKAQETYNELMALGWHCPRCEKFFHFSQVISWGDRQGGATNATCPFCETHIRIDEPKLLKIFDQLAEMDKRIAKLIVDYAESGGEFHRHGPYQAIYYKCAMVMKYEPAFTSLISMRPISYIDRMVLIQIYRELVKAGKIDEVDIYEVKAPIPIEFERPKVSPVSLSGNTSKKHHKHKHLRSSPRSSIQLSLGNIKAPATKVLPNDTELDKLLDEFINS